jgi:WD40 repeat protein
MRTEFRAFGGFFRPDGRVAAAIEDTTTSDHGRGSSYEVLDLQTGSRSPFSDPSDSPFITDVAFDTARQRMAFGYWGGVVDQRDLVTADEVGAKLTKVPPGDAVAVDSLAYIQGGTVLAVARGEEVEFFDADTGAAVLDPVNGVSVAASPDGSVLVTATAGGDLTFRDPATGQPTGPEITSATGQPNNIVLSEDNTRMLVVTRDGGADVYDVGSAVHLGRTFPVALPAGSFNLGATLRPDGGQLAVATDHGVQLWDLDPEAWRDAACRLAGRNVTHDEWEHHLPQGEPYRATCPQWPADM